MDNHGHSTETPQGGRLAPFVEEYPPDGCMPAEAAATIVEQPVGRRHLGKLIDFAFGALPEPTKAAVVLVVDDLVAYAGELTKTASGIDWGAPDGVTLTLLEGALKGTSSRYAVVQVGFPGTPKPRVDDPRSPFGRLIALTEHCGTYVTAEPGRRIWGMVPIPT